MLQAGTDQGGLVVLVSIIVVVVGAIAASISMESKQDAAEEARDEESEQQVLLFKGKVRSQLRNNLDQEYEFGKFDAIAGSSVWIGAYPVYDEAAVVVKVDKSSDSAGEGVIGEDKPYCQSAL